MEAGRTEKPLKIGNDITVFINGNLTTFSTIERDGFHAGGGVVLVHKKDSEPDLVEKVLAALNEYDALKRKVGAAEQMKNALLTAGRFLCSKSYNAAQLAEAVKEIDAALAAAGATC